ncbi:MAG: AMP-binding protein [Burkholderiaceae bacterium]|nr:AMP-binding protein [Burkholderiaceae bacterium]
MKAVGVADYDALNRRSVAKPEWFWNALIEYHDLRFETPYERVLDSSAGVPWTKWCVGGTTNIVSNCLDRYRATPVMDKVALEWEGEDGTRRSWTYAELDAEVCRAANALRARGLGRGDVIAIYMPMVPEVAAAFLAIAKIGAVVLPLFSGFGTSPIIDRLNDGGAKAVFTIDGTRRRGKSALMKPTLDEALASVPTVRQVFVVKHLGEATPMSAPRDLWWHEEVGPQAPSAATEQVPADDPLILIFTSGTTGKAKGAVLTHCGFATKLALDMGLCLDFKPGDRLLWMSDMGWLVGPMIVEGATLLVGRFVLAEGAPDYPQKGRIWRLVQDFAVSFLGIAPTVVRALMQGGEQEARRYDLSSLRIMASTGEPWNPDSWSWLFEHVGARRVPILNYSGGTEIGGGIITGTVLHPLKPCSFAGSVPGMAAAVVDEDGNDLPRGQVGELVMRAPSIGLTRGLWNDPQRYIDSYWSRIPGLWVHGDFASIDADGFWYVHGRSDDTIKIAGKRVGPAEVESILLATGLIAEAAVVGAHDAVKGQALVCVCVPGRADEHLSEKLSQAVTTEFGTPFRPREIVFVADLPKTRNMKVMRRVVRAVLNGQPPGDLSSLVNPESIDGLKQVLARAGSP